MPLHLIANGMKLLFAGGLLYVLVGNLVVALIEAWLLQRKTGLHQDKSSPALMAANFVSTIVGALVIGFFYLGGDVIFDAWPFDSALVICALGSVLMLGLTIAIEGFFFAYLFRKHQIEVSPWRMCAKINLITGVVVFALACGTSDWSGLGVLRYRQTLAALSRPVPDIEVLYFVQETKQVMAKNLRTGVASPLGKPVTLGLSRDALFPVLTSKHQIRLHFGNPWNLPAEQQVIIPDWDVDRERLEQLLEEVGGRRVPGPEYSTRTFANADTRFEVSHLAFLSKFQVRDKSVGTERELSLSIPFVDWNWQHPTQLRDGWCVAALNGRVYLIDLTNFEVARVAFGGSPMVLRNLDP